jgi:hypothetical protein
MANDTTCRTYLVSQATEITVRSLFAQRSMKQGDLPS